MSPPYKVSEAPFRLHRSRSHATPGPYAGVTLQFVYLFQSTAMAIVPHIRPAPFVHGNIQLPENEMDAKTVAVLRSFIHNARRLLVL